MSKEKIPAALLKCVQRPQIKKNGEESLRPIGATEVLDWKEYDDHVVVVTVDGMKFRGEKAAAKDAS